MAITHTDVDDTPIPITFDLTLMLLDHHIMHTYSREIHVWLEKHPIRVIDRRHITAIESSMKSECIGITMDSQRGRYMARESGEDIIIIIIIIIDIWSNRRCFAAEDTTKVTGRKERRASSKIKANTTDNYFQLLQVRFLRK